MKRLVLLLLLLAPDLSIATDGVLEINQTCAVSTGCFPGDTPGFPVSIDAAGSYVLTGNLLVPLTTQSAIAVLADDVSINLNGFSLAGPINCSGSDCPAGTPGVAGVTGGVSSRTAVRNGHVHGFTLGLSLNDACTVERVIAWSNAQDGVRVEDGCLLRHVLAANNGGDGLNAAGGSVIEETITSINGDDGIEVREQGSTLRGNQAGGNAGVGIIAGRDAVVRENLVLSNGGVGISATDAGLVHRNAACNNTGNELSLSGLTGYSQNVLRGTGPTLATGGGVYLPENLCNGATGASSCDP